MAGEQSLRAFEKHILLRILDDKWKELLSTMDHLRQGIHLRGYAVKNPKQEYKREAFERFSQMLVEIKHEAIRIISHVQVQQEDRTEELERQRREELARQMRFEHQDAAAAIAEEVTGITEVVNEPVANYEPVIHEGCKIGRNEPCPCGSGIRSTHPASATTRPISRK